MNTNFILYANAVFSENTVNSYFSHIDKFLNFVGKPEEKIEDADVLLWLEELSNQGLANSSKKQCLDSVKTYFRYLTKKGFIKVNPTVDVEVLNVTNKEKHYMTKEMIQDMMLHAKSYRDKAIILLYVTSGMRVSELTGLTIQQYQDMKNNGDCKIDIVGKRDKHRFVYINKQAQEAIDKYLIERKNAKCDALFITTQGNAIARNNLNNTLKSIAKAAGIPFWNDMCNHQLRAASATIYYENGMHINELQSFMGHTNVTTTLRYTKVNNAKISNQVMEMQF